MRRRQKCGKHRTDQATHERRAGRLTADETSIEQRADELTGDDIEVCIARQRTIRNRRAQSVVEHLPSLYPDIVHHPGERLAAFRTVQRWSSAFSKWYSSSGPHGLGSCNS